MRSSLLLLLSISGLSAASQREEEINKRAMVYVTRTTTMQMGLGDYTEPTRAQAPARPTTMVTSRRRGRLFDFLNSLFGDDDGDVATTPSSINTQPPVASTPDAVNTDSSEETTFGGIGISIPGIAVSIPSVPTNIIPTESSATSTSQSSDDPSPSSPGTDEVESHAQKAMGISYSPYTKSGSCKSSSEVQRDLALLRSYSIIRLYSTDCHGIENTLAAMSSSQQLFVGLPNIDSQSIQNDLSTVRGALQSSSRGWGGIHTIAVGNELVNTGSATASDIASAVKIAKSWLESNASGYNGHVVSVDTLVATVNNPSLCEASDYIAVNCHPFWDGGVQPSNAGSWLNQQIENLRSTCNNNKDIIITETGWPTGGSDFHSSVPSQANQLAAITSIMSEVSTDIFMFTTFNDYWKDGGQYGVEKYWGIYGDPAF